MIIAREGAIHLTIASLKPEFQLKILYFDKARLPISNNLKNTYFNYKENQKRAYNRYTKSQAKRKHEGGVCSGRHYLNLEIIRIKSKRTIIFKNIINDKHN